jgi:branched-chain amino acid transport system ATP-binding protein
MMLGRSADGLTVTNLIKRFGGLVAVDGVSFDVADNGVTALIGPNGAGKTTLFNIISGAFAPTEGRIVFKGEDITGLAPEKIAAKGLVRTFQLVQLFQNLSVVENVKVGHHLHTRGGVLAALARPGWARREERKVDEVARELLDFVGLSDQAEVSASVLPYGQQRLLEIARAMAAEPKLLLLDEPAAGLDREETTRLSGVIRKIAERGTTVLFIEHDMTLVMNTADTVVVLDFGRAIARGTPETVRADPAVIDAYLGGIEAVQTDAQMERAAP